MSTAAAAPSLRSSSPRTPTRGFFNVPNSIIENRAAFTDAEFTLALIIIRRGGAGESVTVSDSNWERWTGMSPRTKEYAVSGLKSKGFGAEGRGDAARFTFEHRAWENFVKTGGASGKARTIGRKTGVPPKAGAKVHPACRERGCALLAQENEVNGLSLVPATPNAQPVAQTDLIELRSRAGEKASKQIKPLFVTSNAQPVAQADEISQIWPKTLAAAKANFPMVGSAFLVQLLGQVSPRFPDATDSEVAEAVKRAYRAKQKKQDSEGLFLLTVPEAIAATRNEPAPAVRAPVQDLTPGVIRLVTHCRQKLLELDEGRGAVFGPELAELAELLKTLHAGGADLEIVEQACERIEAAIVRRLETLVTESERAAVAQSVESRLEQYRRPPATGKGAAMNGVQLQRLGDQFRGRELLAVVGLSSLSVFSV